MQNVILGEYALQLTHSGFFVGLLFFGQLGPLLFLSMMGGLLADRVDLRRSLVSLQLVQGLQSFGLALMRLSPGTLFTEAVLGLLNPETRTLGPMLPFQMRGAIMGAPLPLGQSLLLIWPQITGLIAGMIVVFAAAYVIFQREEVRA